MCTFDPSELTNLWLIKDLNPSIAIELRAIKPGQVKIKLYKPCDFESMEAMKLTFEKDAIQLNEQGFNIYVVMNPISESFNGRSASDDDIVCRELLLIDIDRAKTAKAPANQFELDAALELANTIKRFLTDEGWDEPITVMSGNGYHLYCKLDRLPNTIETKQAVEDFLKALAIKFDNNIVKVDTSVFNASRITKVVGTVARKGSESVDRPYRMARVVS